MFHVNLKSMTKYEFNNMFLPKKAFAPNLNLNFKINLHMPDNVTERYVVFLIGHF